MIKTKFQYDDSDLSANDFLHLLIEQDEVVIMGDTWELWEIGEKIDIEDMREALQEAVCGDNSLVRKLYINEIARLLE